MRDLSERLAALEATGWTLATNREGHVVIERLWRRGVLRESDTTLEGCVSRAEWQQERIRNLNNTKLDVRTGLEHT